MRERENTIIKTIDELFLIRIKHLFFQMSNSQAATFQLVSLLPNSLLWQVDMMKANDPMRLRTLRKTKARNNLKRAILYGSSILSIICILIILIRSEWMGVWKINRKIYKYPCCNDTNCQIKFHTCDRINEYLLRQCKDECGIAPRMLQRIAGGFAVRVTDWPWYVDIRQLVDRRKGKYKYCGGVLINNWFIVTAAHCIHSCYDSYDNPESIEPIEVKVPSISDYFVDVCEATIHKNFNRNTLSDDIALLRLPSSINGRSLVHPNLCLPTSRVDHLSGIVLGRLSVPDGEPKTQRETIEFRQLDSYLIPAKHCFRSYGNFFQINKQICAKSNGSHAPCQGDSGGPLMHFVNNRWELGGVVSYGQGCGMPLSPDVYTRVAVYKKWILSKIGEALT
ncbi:hypothetical protein GJ496_004251 [Pomphorhynchus laevis]|nr:hypothetical protein GJ496_004251 [Pomphorhynchus laevis]